LLQLNKNDYLDINHKLKVDEIIKKNGFKRVFVKSGSWGPCEQFFFETWSK
jgi:hypothetical protein